MTLSGSYVFFLFRINEIIFCNNELLFRKIQNGIWELLFKYEIILYKNEILICFDEIINLLRNISKIRHKNIKYTAKMYRMSLP